MAELGVAVSVISIASIAIQIGDSLIKLKSFWDHVKEAPSEIRWLIEEIETLNIALSEIEPSKAQNGLPPLEPAFSTRCLELCRKGASILEVVVKEADEEIQKGKKVGSIKVMLKKGKMEVLKERLRNAQLMLILSNQTYSEYFRTYSYTSSNQGSRLTGLANQSSTTPATRITTTMDRAPRTTNRRAQSVRISVNRSHPIPTESSG